MPRTNFFTPKEYRQRDIDGTLPANAAVRMNPTTQMKGFNERTRTVDFIISTRSIDRDNDTIDPMGWDLTAYKNNPVVLFAHDYASLPIAKATQISAGPDGLKARAEFTTQDLNPMGETVFRMLEKGFLNATSVGFKPREFKQNRERGGLDFTKQELLEFSVVPVPSNPSALVLDQMKSAGIDPRPFMQWAERAGCSADEVLCFDLPTRKRYPWEEEILVFDAEWIDPTVMCYDEDDLRDGAREGLSRLVWTALTDMATATTGRLFDLNPPKDWRHDAIDLTNAQQVRAAVQDAVLNQVQRHVRH